MADHGLHYGRETYTFPGFIHHKIPPLFVALPNQFLQERPHFSEALEQNQNRILSHLDLHQTFMHLAYGDRPIDGQDADGSEYARFMGDFIADGTFRYQFHPQAPNQTSYAQTYGRSLLLPISEDRSCRTGGIPHDYCAFQPFLDLDPGKKVDAVFLRGALVLLGQRMNSLAKIHRVDDVCLQSNTTLMLDPASTSVEGKNMLEEASSTGSFDDIGTEDLVMESAYASAAPTNFHRPTLSTPPGAGSDAGNQGDEGRVFYFMIRDRHRPNRKYSVTMKEEEVVRGIGDSITLQQMSAYASAWQPCARRISQGGKAIGKWNDVVKHFCVCSPP
ncbi:hypothetical protein BGZ83_000046 [Gryganskiella cystojenkinii]|nr:hypothetical protein BGZ83_000046 [Gryganskiella cystojenkinii]